jgi:hypothetical protein
MSPEENSDKILTLQVHHQNLDPRTFKVPVRWIYLGSILAWALLLVTLITSVYAVKEYFSERLARPELVKELENEIQELKITLEKRSIAPVTSGTPLAVAPQTDNKPVDPKATDQKPAPGAGEVIEGKQGVWTGLAENIAQPTGDSPLTLEDPRIDWQGKYAIFTLNLVFKDPGKGSQQGHIVGLARANDRIFAHPEGVMNNASGAYLFNPDRGEYFSVARFRVLKARFGPFETQKQLSDVQIFLFDLNNKLIAVQSYHYGK